MTNVNSFSRNELWDELYKSLHPEDIKKEAVKNARHPKFSTIDEIFKYIEGGIFEFKSYFHGRIALGNQYNIYHGFGELFEALNKIENYTKGNIEKFNQLIDEVNELEILYEWLLDLGLTEIAKDENYSHLTAESLYANQDYLFNIYYVGFVFKNSFKNFDDVPDCTSSAKNQPSQFKTRDQNEIPVSFTYKRIKSNYTVIKDVFDDLIKFEYISGEYKNFYKIFSGEKPVKKIVWKKTPTELAYFIKLIHNSLKVVDYLKQQHWKVTSLCFSDSEGNSIVPYSLHGMKKPAKVSADLLEKIAGRLL